MSIPPISSTSSTRFPVPLREAFDGLKVGQVLMSDVVSEGGKKIGAAGTRVTSDLLNKLKNSALADGIKQPLLAAG